MRQLKKGATGLGRALWTAFRVILAVIVASSAVVYYMDMREVGAAILAVSVFAIFPTTGRWLTRALGVPQKKVLIVALVSFVVGMGFVSFMGPSPERIAKHEAQVLAKQEEKEVASKKAKEEKAIKDAEKAKEKRESDAIKQEAQKARDAKRRKDYAIIKGRDAVESALKDGNSAKFRGDFVTKDLAYCGEVNAKNSFGAYAGYTEFVVVGSIAFIRSGMNDADFVDIWNEVCAK